MLTKSDLEQIKNYLALYGKKDSQLEAVPVNLDYPEVTFEANDYLSVVQDNKNKTIKIKDLEKVFLLTFLTDEDFREALKGKIPEEMLENACVTTEKLADGAVTTIKLGTDAITTAKIATGAITGEKIANNTIQGSAFAANSITTDKIVDGTVTGDKLADGSIQSVDIKDNTLSGSKFVDGSISGSKIQDDVIESKHLLDNSIPASKIKDGSIESIDIKDGTLNGSKIKDNTIESAKLANSAITADKIIDNSITTSKIADDAVTEDKIVDDSITTNKIANSSVTTDKIVDKAITEDKLANGAVTTAKLADGLISEIQNITDATPTIGSVKPVQSGGVKTAIDNIAFLTNEKVNTVGIDDEPTAGSENLVKSGGVQNELALGAVYDVSAKNPIAGPNNDGKFESLAALLSDANLNTLIPASVRKGGMSIKFVQSSDNKYVQYRLMADEFSTNTDKWSFSGNDVYIKNPEYVKVVTDAEGRILYGVKTDGDFYFGTGVPGQIQEEIDAEEARATQVEATKVDKVTGKGLSTEDFTTAEKTKLSDLPTNADLTATLNTKVDKEDGKSLIDEEFAESSYTEEDAGFLEATTDADKKILEGITADGKKIIAIPLAVLGNEIDYVKNPDFMTVLLDNDEKVIEGIHPNGKRYLSMPTNQDEIILAQVETLREKQKKEKFIDISRDNFDYHEECIFHDDFYREIPDSSTPWIIGSNSSAVNLNKYDYISLYDTTVDDGFRISESSGEYSLTNVSSSVNGFRLIKYLTKSSSIVVEINNNTLINKYQAICFNVEDTNNYELLRVHRTSTTNLVIEYVVTTNGVEIHRSLPVEQKYNGNAIRFYFIQKQLRILLDDTIVFTGEINNVITNLGLYVDSSHEYLYKFFNVYYVQSERMVTDNTGSVDKQITQGVTFTVGQSQTIDTSKEYCYTLVNDVVNFGYCERFEVRNNEALTVTDDRQENMFTPQKLPILCKWILSFDLMFPSDFVVDEPVQGSTTTSFDCFFQLHESSADAMAPCVMLTSEPSENSESGAGIFVKIESLKRQVDGFYNPDTQIKKEIYPVEPGKWHHFDIMCKQGYLAEHNPFTIVLIDGKECFRSVAPNSYNIAKQDYPKYGMYKPMWSGGRTTSTNKRVIYFDNVKITY